MIVYKVLRRKPSGKLVSALIYLPNWELEYNFMEVTYPKIGYCLAFSEKSAAITYATNLQSQEYEDTIEVWECEATITFPADCVASRYWVDDSLEDFWVRYRKVTRYDMPLVVDPPNHSVFAPDLKPIHKLAVMKENHATNFK